MKLQECQLDERLSALTEYAGDHCVSLHMPTHVAGKETMQGRVRMKNLLRQAQQSLEDRGLRRNEAEALLKPAERLIDDSDFWQHQTEGLSVFLSKDVACYCHLHSKVREQAAVDDIFAVRPLLNLLGKDMNYLVIALSLHSVRLFEGRASGLEEMDLSAWPSSLRSLEAMLDLEPSLQFHTSGAVQPNGGKRSATFHGQGANERQQKERIFEFFRALDPAITDLLRGRREPMIPVGVERIVTIFREAVSYPNISDDIVEGSPEHWSDPELFERVKKVADPMMERHHRAGLERFEAAKDGQRSVSDIDKIAHAVSMSLVDTLLVSTEKRVAGAEQDGLIEVCQGMSVEDDRCDLLDRLVWRALNDSTKVYGYPDDSLPEGAPCAAVVRAGADAVLTS